jgi:hypothetical protein
LVCDEVHKLFSAADTEELADFLEMARNTGLCFWASHQYLDQLLPQENRSDTRLVHALLSQSSLRVYFKLAHRDAREYSAWAYMFQQEMPAALMTPKHELSQTKFRPYLDYVETESETWSEGESEGESEDAGVSLGAATTKSRSTSHSRSKYRNRSRTDASSESVAEVVMESDSYGGGAATGQGSAQTFLPDQGASADPTSETLSEHAGINTFNASASTRGTVLTAGTSHAYTEGEGESETRGIERGISHQSSTTAHASQGKNHANNHGYAVTRGLQPVTLHEEFRELTSVTYPGTDEVKERFITRLTEQPRQHYVLRLGLRPAVPMVSPQVEPASVLPREVVDFDSAVQARYPTAVEVLQDVEQRVPEFLEVQRLKKSQAEAEQADGATASSEDRTQEPRRSRPGHALRRRTRNGTSNGSPRILPLS